jgi:hypothetical protein
MKITIRNPLPATTPGRCRYCRCTDARACDEGCAWLDRHGTVCSSPECVQRWAFALARLYRKQQRADALLAVRVRLRNVELSARSSAAARRRLELMK